MNGDARRKGLETAIALRDDLMAVLSDPSADPAALDDAREKLALVNAGLAAIAESTSAARQTELRVKWIALIRAYRATGKARPTLIDVAEKMGWNSEQPLRDYCRDLGVKDWHDVHAIVAAARV